MHRFLENREEGVDKEKYLDICDAMGVEPVMEDMPIDYEDLPIEVQDVMSLHSFLPSRIAEFSGTYLGKDYGNLSFLFNMHGIDEKSWQMFYFRVMMLIDSIQMSILDKKRKAKEASSKKPGTVSYGK